MRKVCNDIGLVYETPRTRVTEIQELNPGDHIAFNRKLYWHHAIVKDVDEVNMFVDTIEYRTPVKQEGSGVAVRESRHHFLKETMYLMDYTDQVCLPPNVVVKQATDLLGKKEYNPLTNNCEHFATLCKTGRKNCTQTPRFGKVVGNGVLHAAANAPKVIGKKAMTTPAIAATSEAAAAFAGAAVELSFMGHDIHQARKKKRAGELSQREFDDTVGKRTAVAACRVAGGVGGALIGQCVVPGAGAVLGGIVGSSVGTGVGALFGEAGVTMRNKYESREKKKCILF